MRERTRRRYGESPRSFAQRRLRELHRQGQQQQKESRIARDAAAQRREESSRAREAWFEPSPDAGLPERAGKAIGRFAVPVTDLDLALEGVSAVALPLVPPGVATATRKVATRLAEPVVRAASTVVQPLVDIAGQARRRYFPSGDIRPFSEAGEIRMRTQAGDPVTVRNSSEITEDVLEDLMSGDAVTRPSGLVDSHYVGINQRDALPGRDEGVFGTHLGHPVRPGRRSLANREPPLEASYSSIDIKTPRSRRDAINAAAHELTHADQFSATGRISSDPRSSTGSLWSEDKKYDYPSLDPSATYGRVADAVGWTPDVRRTLQGYSDEATGTLGGRGGVRLDYPDPDSPIGRMTVNPGAGREYEFDAFRASGEAVRKWQRENPLQAILDYPRYLAGLSSGERQVLTRAASKVAVPAAAGVATGAAIVTAKDSPALRKIYEDFQEFLDIDHGLQASEIERPTRPEGAQESAEPPTTEIDKALEQVYRNYPRLQAHDFAVLDKRDAADKPGGYAEFFSPDEPPEYRPDDAPAGVPAIDIYGVPEGGNLQDLIYGEMLHHLPDADPEFDKLREEFREARTEEQRFIDEEESYPYVKEHEGETRNYDDWLEHSRLDAWIRARLAPANAPQWQDMPYSREQDDILEKMRRHLSNKYPGRTPRLP